MNFNKSDELDRIEGLVYLDVSNLLLGFRMRTGEFYLWDFLTRCMDGCAKCSEDNHNIC